MYTADELRTKISALQADIDAAQTASVYQIGGRRVERNLSAMYKRLEHLEDLLHDAVTSSGKMAGLVEMERPK
jgi:hypothetical protein